MSLNSERIVALKLHALHREDREWIISRLDPAAQSRLAPLLEELNQIGFEIEPSLIDSIQNNNPGLSVVSPNVVTWIDAESTGIIDAASSSQIELVFDQEPAVLFQTLGAIRPWTWAPDFDRMPTKLGRLAKAVHGENVSPLPAVKKALVKAVARQLSATQHLGRHLQEDKPTRYLPASKKPLLQKFVGKLIAWHR